MRRRAAFAAFAALGFAIALAAPDARAQVHIGEVRFFAYNFCPSGWAAADGSLMAIADNEALFNLYGTTFGGDGQTTFAMPDLRDRVPIGAGQGAGLTPRTLGEQGGAEEVTLTVQQMPAHTHTTGASTQASNAFWPSGRLRTPRSVTPYYRSGGSADTTMAPDAVGTTGANAPIPNLPPFTTITACVSLFGVFPSMP